MGCTALIAAALAAAPTEPLPWISLWLVEAAVALAIGMASAARKADRAGLPLLSGPGRKFLAGLLPPLAVGAVLTVALFQAGAVGTIPGAWLLLFRRRVVSGGAASVRIVPLMEVFHGHGAWLYLRRRLGQCLAGGRLRRASHRLGLLIVVKHGG
jgi:hypothetical protein